MASSLQQNRCSRHILQRLIHRLWINPENHWVPNTTGHYTNRLGLFLTSCPDKCLSKVLPPLGTSDHSLITVQIDAKPKAYPDVPFHRTIFRYAKADRDSFGSYMMKASLSIFFKHAASKTLSLVWSFLEWIVLYSNKNFSKNQIVHPGSSRNTLQSYINETTTSISRAM